MKHRCDETCVCPVHQTPLMYWLKGELHACPESTCAYAHGLEHLSAEERTGIAGGQAIRVITWYLERCHELEFSWEQAEALLRNQPNCTDEYVEAIRAAWEMGL